MAEGAELIRCALDAGVPVESVYVSPDGADDRAVQDVCRRAEAARRAGLPPGRRRARAGGRHGHPQPVLAVLPMLEEPAAGPALVGPRRARSIVVLVDVRDPGNAGTVLRAADASGVDAVVYAGDSVDPYNPKTVRSSAGSLFHVPLRRAARPGARWPPSWRRPASAPWPRWCGTARTTPALDWSVPTALFLGNESSGLDPALAGALSGDAGHPDGGAGRVAQRGRGQRGGLLRGVPPTPGRRCRAT